jgi:ribosomal protein S18 acetylase RimI-like enzyme
VDGLILSEPADPDIDELMTWFNASDAVDRWAGPSFRFPFDRASFIEDCRLGDMASRVLKRDTTLLAFGQFYLRYGRINLARLVVSPAHRGQGYGRALLRALFADARRYIDAEEFSLFVYRDNPAALGCYRSAGFVVTDYPDDAPLADECYYLVRPQHGATTDA